MLSPREKRPDCTPFYGKAVWHIGNNPQERARQRLRVVVCSLAIAPLRFAMTLSRPSRQACSNITPVAVEVFGTASAPYRRSLPALVPSSLRPEQRT